MLSGITILSQQALQELYAGLNSFNQKLIVIAGGYDKKIPFEPLAEPVNKNVKILILLGATADKIEKAVTESPLYPESGLKIVRVKTP